MVIGCRRVNVAYGIHSFKGLLKAAASDIGSPCPLLIRIIGVAGRLAQIEGVFGLARLDVNGAPLPVRGGHGNHSPVFWLKIKGDFASLTIIVLFKLKGKGHGLAFRPEIAAVP